MKKNTVRVFDTILKKVVRVEVSDEVRTHYKILLKNYVILAEQIRTIDRNRLQNYVGSVEMEVMAKVDKALKISMGVNENE